MNTPHPVVIFIGILVLVFGSVFVGVNLVESDSSQQEFFNEYLKLNNMVDEYSISVMDGWDAYNYGSEYYDISDFDSAINKFSEAQDYLDDAMNHLSNIRVQIDYLIEIGPYEEFNKILVEAGDLYALKDDMVFALYESAEYIESASRSYNNDKWDMGDNSIELQNKRIKDYDRLIEEETLERARVNKKLEEYLRNAQ